MPSPTHTPPSRPATIPPSDRLPATAAVRALLVDGTRGHLITARRVYGSELHRHVPELHRHVAPARGSDRSTDPFHRLVPPTRPPERSRRSGAFEPLEPGRTTSSIGSPPSIRRLAVAGSTASRRTRRVPSTLRRGVVRVELPGRPRSAPAFVAPLAPTRTPAFRLRRRRLGDGDPARSPLQASRRARRGGYGPSPSTGNPPVSDAATNAGRSPRERPLEAKRRGTLERASDRPA